VALEIPKVKGWTPIDQPNSSHGWSSLFRAFLT
jgi:hypothetical protein